MSLPVEKQITTYDCKQCGDKEEALNWEEIIAKEKRCQNCIDGIPMHKRSTFKFPDDNSKNKKSKSLRRVKPKERKKINQQENGKPAEKEHKYTCLNTEECGITHYRSGMLWHCPDCNSQVKKYS